MRSGNASDSQDPRDSLINRKRLFLFSAIDSMQILNLEDAVHKVIAKQSEVLAHQLKFRLLRADREYLYDRSVKWFLHFFQGYKTPERFPFAINCLGRNIDDHPKSITLPSITGFLETANVKANSIRLRYNHMTEIIHFRIGFTVSFRPFLEEIRSCEETHVNEDPNRPINPITASIIHDIPVPLQLLQTWLRGKVEDTNANIAIRDEDLNTIDYEHSSRKYNKLDNLYVSNGRFIWKYPKRFVNWIRNNRLRIFRYFGEAECEIDDDVRTALIKFMNFDIREASSYTLHLSEDDLQERADLVSEALQISSIDRKRLKEIGRVRIPLSYSQWAQRLWFKSKGAVLQFFQREGRLGLVIVTQTKSGNKNTGSTFVQLTPTAVKLLRAFEEHLKV